MSKHIKNQHIFEIHCLQNSLNHTIYFNKLQNFLLTEIMSNKSDGYEFLIL